MGYGELVGNESVHWTVVHEDEGGRETGSVHGRDPIKFGDIGGKNGKGRMGVKTKAAPAKSFLPKPTFRVRLMFATKDQAARAKEAAEIVEMGGSYFVVLDVPAVRRKKEQVDPPRPPAEIRVDW